MTKNMEEPRLYTLNEIEGKHDYGYTQEILHFQRNLLIALLSNSKICCFNTTRNHLFKTLSVRSFQNGVTSQNLLRLTRLSFVVLSCSYSEGTVLTGFKITSYHTKFHYVSKTYEIELGRNLYVGGILKLNSRRILCYSDPLRIAEIKSRRITTCSFGVTSQLSQRGVRPGFCSSKIRKNSTFLQTFKNLVSRNVIQFVEVVGSEANVIKEYGSHDGLECRWIDTIVRTNKKSGNDEEILISAVSKYMYVDLGSDWISWIYFYHSDSGDVIHIMKNVCQSGSKFFCLNGLFLFSVDYGTGDLHIFKFDIDGKKETSFFERKSFHEGGVNDVEVVHLGLNKVEFWTCSNQRSDADTKIKLTSLHSSGWSDGIEDLDNVERRVFVKEMSDIAWGETFGINLGVNGKFGVSKIFFLL